MATITTYPMGTSDSTATLQAAIDAAARANSTYTLPSGGYRLLSTGLGYSSNAKIVLVGDLYNDHGPAVGTLYCLTNRTKGRLTNVTITCQGGAFVGASSATNGATRKGLGIVATDGFTVSNAQTAGPLNGFGMEVKNSTGGYLNGLNLLGGANTPGADGLHFYGACSKISGSTINVSSGDDAISFTSENSESTNALMEQITLSGLTLNSAAFSSIKFYTSTTTGAATIRNINLSNIVGRITQGPTGCPLMIENNGHAQGCIIDSVTITNADLDFGAATQNGPAAYLNDCTNITLKNLTLRGRRDNTFITGIRCKGLFVTGEVWETIPGNSPNNMIQLVNCGNYNISLVVRNASGVKIGTVTAVNTGTDTTARLFKMTPV